jgi:hypothetical protein
MKRTLLLALSCAVLALFSCEIDIGQIVNDSSYSVSGETAKGMSFNLAPGEAKDHEYNNDTIKKFSATPARVSYRYRGDDAEFYDNPAIDLYVVNTHILGFDIELSAKGLIEYTVSGVLQDEPITVGPGPFVPALGDTLQIFTLKPVFTAYAIDVTDPLNPVKYLATADWYYDAGNNRILVTVH